MPEAEPPGAIRDTIMQRTAELETGDPGFARFLALTVANVDEEDFAGLSADGFEAILRHAYAGLGKRPGGGHRIDIWQPEDSTGRFQVVDIFTDNMPFLVDSVLAAIRAMGGTVRLIAHPILPLEPGNGQPRIAGKAREDTEAESFLHIHIDPLSAEQQAGLRAELDEVLAEVRRTVDGWRPMLERLRRLVQDFRKTPPKNVNASMLAEVLHFLAWLADHNFTFLGMREYRLTGEGEDARLEPLPGIGLGILENPEVLFLRSGSDYVEMTPQHLAFLQKGDPLMVTKANIRSRVHRRSHMDYVGVKLYGEDGELSGELRIIGLFTSMSLATPHTEVPVLRRKISEVMRRSGHDPKSHAGKALMAALDNYPREELFQISEDQLLEFATIISDLPDRPRIRVLPRIDPFDNFVSVLVYLPRDRYTSDVRAKIGDHLAHRYDARVSAYFPHFPEGELVRVHFILGRNGGETPRPGRKGLEKEVEALTYTFGDRLMHAAEDPAAISDYWNAFSPAYQALNTHLDALDDIAVFRQLGDSTRIAVRLNHAPGDANEYSLKVYHAGSSIPLSDRVPMLENFGFRVIDERTFSIRPRDGQERFLHDMLIAPADESTGDLSAIAPVLEEAMLAVWEKQAESDGFNQLTTRAAMLWDDITIIRALARYLRQVGTAYSQRYVWTALAAHPQVAASLVELFYALHQPVIEGNRERRADKLREKITAALADIRSADEDQIIRQFLNLIEASVRTNYFQPGADGGHRPALAIKFDSGRISNLPEPKPYREIFVYSPEVEGVHLRGGAISRGGLRWSDRPQDFRTEVLSLVKAQMVKNAVIVPVGAKGGFVPKLMPPNPDRETFLKTGTDAYKTFVGTLLDVTDNLDGDTVIPPDNVNRRDGDDPYLVVAADKGTATFSDTANAISESRGFWLGDAFASGGSAGYDHKKMGITARGAWEAVKRHFREMDRDIQNEPFTVAGVGDMSGDVFGNGMLLSRQIRLVAAFDHRDIFIDPDPDPETGFLERKRLFGMARSTWQDYDKGLLSEGGGIYSRSEKTIDLSPEARTVLGLGGDMLTPQMILKAILKADVDLLWFGGIGTYIRASTESDLDAGDRANDAIRVTGADLRAKVIGEGANLGITHLGRIEYARRGGRINTDAIDNSAGVNSSDLEVNIKIALGTLVRAGTLDIPARNAFLAGMTEEVAGLCLRNNYLQTLSLSLTERRGMATFPDLVTFMQELESQGHLNRAVEHLPDEATLAERAMAHQPFTRPELSVLLAYAKNTLYAELLESPVPDDPYLANELYRYFPDTLKAQYPETIDTHRLRREVIATVLANAMINRGGPAFIHRMTAATAANPSLVACAYAAARDAYGLAELNAEIDALDTKISGSTQLELYAEVQTLMAEQTLWFLRNVSFEGGLSAIVERYRAGVAEIRKAISRLLPAFVATSVAEQAARFCNGGTPRETARRIAELSALTLASDIVLAAEKAGASVTDAAEAYFLVLNTFNLGRITEQGGRIELSDRFDRMALDRALANVMRAQRDLTCDILTIGTGPIPARFEAWHDARANEVERIVSMVSALTEEELTVSRLSVAAGLLTDLVRR